MEEVRDRNVYLLTTHETMEQSGPSFYGLVPIIPIIPVRLRPELIRYQRGEEQKKRSPSAHSNNVSDWQMVTLSVSSVKVSGFSSFSFPHIHSYLFPFPQYVLSYQQLLTVALDVKVHGVK